MMLHLTPAKQVLAKVVDRCLQSMAVLLGANRSSPLVGADGTISQVAEKCIHKILVVEYWGVGDLVILSPTLAALRRRFPQAQISLLARPVACELFAHADWVEEVIEAELPWTRFRGKYNPFRYDFPYLMRLLQRVRSKRFDLAISTRMDVRDNLLLWWTGARYRVGYAVTGGGSCLTDVVPTDGMAEHRVDAGLHLARYLGAPVDGLVPHVPLPPEALAGAKAHLEARGLSASDLLVGVHPWARNVARRWSVRNFMEVCDRLKAEYRARVVVFLGPGERSQALTPFTDRADLVVEGEPIARVAALISQCALFICNDGGLMHLAAARGVPVVGVFGPTEPRWFRPFGTQHRVSLLPNVTCRPCYDYCWQPRPFCIEDLPVEQVLRDVDRLARIALQRASGPSLSAHSGSPPSTR